MEINWNIIRRARKPAVCGAPRGRMSEFSKKASKQGSVTFRIWREMANAVHVEAFPGTDVNEGVALDFIPDGAERFNYHVRNIIGRFGCDWQEWYFKVSKKQNTPELKQYLLCFLRQAVPSLEKVDAKVIIFGVSALV